MRAENVPLESVQARRRKPMDEGVDFIGEALTALDFFTVHQSNPHERAMRLNSPKPERIG